MLHVVTAAVTTRLMLGQLRALREAGFEVFLMSDPGPELDAVAAQEGITAVPVRMEREIAFWQDLRSLWRLWRTLRRLRPALINVGTAKAGLLAGLAAALARVPCRIYTIHGLRLETTRGLKRRLLTWTEWISCHCAQRVLCVSESVRARAVELGLTEAARTCLLGAGSFNGINLDRFRLTPERQAAAQQLRAELGIPAEAPVIGFVGRLTRDKGLPELVEAFQQVRARVPEARLLVLGRHEAGDPVPAETRQAFETDPAILAPGYFPQPAPYYHLMDLFVLPTYREGFPTVVLEAAAVGLPTVTTTATGARDAVVDGVTGLLVPVGDATALGEALTRVLLDDALRTRMGRAAHARAEQEFGQARVWGEMVALYRELLAARGLLPPEAPAPPASRPPGSRAARAAKRGVDLLGAVVGLVVTAPLMAAVALALRLTQGAPVLFRQSRAGQFGRCFTLYKFRTMRDEHDAQGRLRPDAERLTPLGRWLRRLSLDELPQFWNVLRGEMSLVGPRPLLPEYLPAYTARERLRHLVKPGITGRAQINGRHQVLFSERLEMDSWYVEHWSLWRDLQILLLTLPRALFLRGAEACQEEAIDDRGLWRRLEHLRPGRGESL